MVAANRPWRLVPGLKSALVAALTTGFIATTLTKTFVHVRVDASAADFTITLPAASGVKGHELTICKIDSSSHTVSFVVAPGSGDALNLPAGRNPLTSQWQVI